MVKLAICVGDGGAFNFFFANEEKSVYNRLRRLGAIIDVYAAPKAVAIDKLKSANIEHTPSDGVDIDFNIYAEALFGTIGKRKSFGLFLDGTKAAQAAGVPAIWCGDYFGSGCEDVALDLRPTALFAPDSLTGRRFLELRPGYLSEQVVVTGSPVFDGIRGFDYESARTQAREALEVGNTKLVLHFADGIDQNGFEPYRVLGPWLRRNSSIKFGVYFHPNDRKVRPEEVARLEAQLRADLGDRLVDAGKLAKVTGLARAAAADMVTTGYSTTGVEACFIGTPTAFIMLEKGQEVWATSKNLKKPFFPVLEDKKGSPAPAVGIFSEDDAHELELAFYASRYSVMHRLADERFQELCDGHAAKRVVDEIVKQL